MDGQSVDIVKQKIEQLKQIIPEAFTEGKIDWEKLRIALGENIEFKNERYHLNWAGKTDAYRLLQKPTFATLKPVREESVDFDTTENVFIEGDNLEVLKVLQKSYFGKIKMIYIDPPYNTGNDLIYKDDFSETLREYREKVGDIDENGNATRAGLFKNTKDNGRYHSNWLNMMLPRLFLARSLLRDDGVIFVSIDDNEVHNLRLLMDEIFGEENFVGSFVRKTGIAPRQDVKFIATQHDYVICYAKDIFNLNLNRKISSLKGFIFEDEFVRERGKYRLNKLDRGSIRYSEKFDYPITGPDGSYIWPGGSQEDRQWTWRWSKEKVDWGIKNNFIVFKQNKDGKWSIYYKEYEFVDNEGNYRERTNPYETLILEAYNEKGSNLINELFQSRVFDYSKPIELIKHLLKIGSFNSDLILDFFAGSGTTAHAVMELNKEDGGNRKFILVQLPEPCDPESEAHKAGFKTIADICKERIRRAASKIKQEIEDEKRKKDGELKLEEQQEKKLDLGFKVFKLSESNFKQWIPIKTDDPENLKQSILEFVNNIKQDATVESILYELMLKNGQQLTEKIKRKDGYYIVGEIIFILEKINESVIDEILKLKPKPQKVIVLDKLFNGNDQLKTNTYLQFKDLNIDFKSI